MGSNEYVLAADLGGTNLRLAAVKKDGTILSSARRETPSDGSCNDIADLIASASSECLSSAGDGGVVLCMAVPALVDARDQKVISAPNLPQLNGTDLGSLVAERLGIPVLVENDANAAAVGEARLGASKGSQTSICITLGTGVGGGLILGGALWRGIDGTAGEIGHICVEPAGVKCGCGSDGCLEQYASASAVVRMAVELSHDYPESSWASTTGLTAKDVYDAGSAGDRLGLRIFCDVGRYLGTALAGLVNVLNPEVVVIGGGASAGWDLFVDEVRKTIDQKAFERPAKRVRLVRAELGDSAGILGAAQMAFDSLHE